MPVLVGSAGCKVTPAGVRVTSGPTDPCDDCACRLFRQAKRCDGLEIDVDLWLAIEDIPSSKTILIGQCAYHFKPGNNEADTPGTLATVYEVIPDCKAGSVYLYRYLLPRVITANVTNIECVEAVQFLGNAGCGPAIFSHWQRIRNVYRFAGSLPLVYEPGLRYDGSPRIGGWILRGAGVYIQEWGDARCSASEAMTAGVQATFTIKLDVFAMWNGPGIPWTLAWGGTKMVDGVCTFFPAGGFDDPVFGIPSGPCRPTGSVDGDPVPGRCDFSFDRFYWHLWRQKYHCVTGLGAIEKVTTVCSAVNPFLMGGEGFWKKNDGESNDVSCTYYFFQKGDTCPYPSCGLGGDTGYTWPSDPAPLTTPPPDCCKRCWSRWQRSWICATISWSVWTLIEKKCNDGNPFSTPTNTQKKLSGNSTSCLYEAVMFGPTCDVDGDCADGDMPDFGNDPPTDCCKRCFKLYGIDYICNKDGYQAIERLAKVCAEENPFDFDDDGLWHYVGTSGDTCSYVRVIETSDGCDADSDCDWDTDPSPPSTCPDDCCDGACNCTDCSGYPATSPFSASGFPLTGPCSVLNGSGTFTLAGCAANPGGFPDPPWVLSCELGVWYARGLGVVLKKAPVVGVDCGPNKTICDYRGLYAEVVSDGGCASVGSVFVG